MIAKIRIDIAHTLVDKPYDYKIPEYLKAFLQVGMRVRINFHGTNRQGVIVGFKKTSTQKPFKMIQGLFELSPSYSIRIIEVAEILSYQYARPMWDYLNLLTPLNARIRSIVRLSCEYHPEKYESIFQGQSSISHLPDDPRIQEGLKNHNLSLEEIKSPPPLEKISLLSLTHEVPVKGSKQHALISLLRMHPELSMAEVKRHGISLQTVRSLAQKDIIQIREKPRYAYIPFEPTKASYEITLKDDLLDLPSITWIKPGSSNKTLKILLSLLTLKPSSTYSFIVFPELAIVDFFAAKLNEYFPTLSVLKMTESFKKQWEASKRYETYGLMNGTMHGLAAHIDLTDQVIVMDAHDSSYRMDYHPIFELNDILNIFQEKKNATIVYLSNHPTFKQIHAFKEHGIQPFDYLPEKPLRIEPIDMKVSKLTNADSRISLTLLDAIKKTLEKGEKCLLLHNFKGQHAHYACPICQRKARCYVCGELLKPQDDTLMCKKDNFTVELPLVCENCETPMISMYEGLIPVYEELKNHFPETPITHIERHSAHLLDTLTEFNDNGSILLGTQVITKGFVFKGVGLKAVLDLDRMVAVKAYDIAFQNMSLIHRLAMIHPEAPLYIQTSDSNHLVIRALHDLDAYYEASLKEIKKLKLPPFTSMAQLVFEVNDKNRLELFGKNIHSYLKKALRDHVTIIGPSYKMNQGIITLKSGELENHTKALKNCVKAFIDEIRIEVKHFNYVV